jgi:hypothetical protein
MERGKLQSLAAKQSSIFDCEVGEFADLPRPGVSSGWDGGHPIQFSSIHVA